MDTILTAHEEFPKIPRLSREVVITEKIDGTNGQILISDDCTQMFVGSKSRWLEPGADNFGFFKWCNDRREQLIATLGPGRYYGEFWGSGIQRGYGLVKGEKRFSLFNTHRWAGLTTEIGLACVPVLARGMFDTMLVEQALNRLASTGSVASPGFMRPEGVVVYHTAGGYLFKKALEKDESPKGAQ